MLSVDSFNQTLNFTFHKEQKTVVADAHHYQTSRNLIDRHFHISVDGRVRNLCDKACMQLATSFARFQQVVVELPL
jgi:hypothetical protein